jgi:poly(A) polymerase
MIFRDNEFGTVQEDAERRDFTVNALFYDPVNDKLFDFTGKGVEDIQNGVIRAIGDPALRFEEDPVRVLRALKLVGQYGFTLEPETEKALREAIPLIKLASDSRMTLEMEKILKNPYGEQILESFQQFGFLSYFLPEIASHWDSPNMRMTRALLAKRNERIRNGEYRESISLAIAVFAYPAAARWIASAKKSSLQTKAFRIELQNLTASFFLPRHPTHRAIGAAVRTLLLQADFSSQDPQIQDNLKRHPGYAHARELACIRNLVSPFREDFESVFPPSHKEFRKHKRNRKRK